MWWVVLKRLWGLKAPRCNVGLKILPTGVKPERFLSALSWQDTVWRRGELLSQVQACCRPSI